MNKDSLKSYGTLACLLIVCGVIAKTTGFSVLLVALVTAILATNLFSLTAGTLESASRLEKPFIAWAIALMGCTVNLRQFAAIGFESSLFVVCLTMATIGLAILITKRSRLSPPVGLLIGIGLGICGNAAVLAASPLITKKREDVVASIAAISLVGVAGLVLLPAIIHAFALSDAGAGVLVGGSLQSMGYVVASGFSLSKEVGELSVLVKMERVVLIAPLLLVLGLKQAWGKTQSPLRGLPWYLYVYVAGVALGTWFPLPAEVVSALKWGYKMLLAVAMLLIGLTVRFQISLQRATRGISLAVALTLFQILALLVFIWILPIH